MPQRTPRFRALERDRRRCYACNLVAAYPGPFCDQCEEQAAARGAGQDDAADRQDGTCPWCLAHDCCCVS